MHRGEERPRFVDICAGIGPGAPAEKFAAGEILKRVYSECRLCTRAHTHTHIPSAGGFPSARAFSTRIRVPLFRLGCFSAVRREDRYFPILY